jgi:hypothetical protein
MGRPWFVNCLLNGLAPGTQYLRSGNCGGFFDRCDNGRQVNRKAVRELQQGFDTWVGNSTLDRRRYCGQHYISTLVHQNKVS